MAPRAAGGNEWQRGGQLSGDAGMSAEPDETSDSPSPHELANDALADACAGWRMNRRCVDPEGRRVLHPHPSCLHAQYLHDVILLNAGLPLNRAPFRGSQQDP
jgi:hypothetical protein